MELTTIVLLHVEQQIILMVVRFKLAMTLSAGFARHRLLKILNYYEVFFEHELILFVASSGFYTHGVILGIVVGD